MRLLFCAVVCMMLGTEAFASDYVIEPSVYVRGDILQIRGRVSYGNVCGKLKIRLRVENDKGYSRILSVYVEDVGGSGSRLIDYHTKVKADSRARWFVHVEGYSCGK